MRVEPSDSSVVTTTNPVLISDRPCIIQGVALAPAAASCTVILYDPLPFLPGTATTVGAVSKVVLAAAAAGDTANLAQSGSGIAFNNGCIALITGGTATIIYAKI